MISKFASYKALKCGAIALLAALFAFAVFMAVPKAQAEEARQGGIQTVENWREISGAEGATLDRTDDGFVFAGNTQGEAKMAFLYAYDEVFNGLDELSFGFKIGKIAAQVGNDWGEAGFALVPSSEADPYKPFYEVDGAMSFAFQLFDESAGTVKHMFRSFKSSASYAAGAADASMDDQSADPTALLDGYINVYNLKQTAGDAQYHYMYFNGRQKTLCPFAYGDYGANMKALENNGYRVQIFGYYGEENITLTEFNGNLFGTKADVPSATLSDETNIAKSATFTAMESGLKMTGTADPTDMTIPFIYALPFTEGGRLDNTYFTVDRSGQTKAIPLEIGLANLDEGPVNSRQISIRQAKNGEPRVAGLCVYIQNNSIQVAAKMSDNEGDGSWEEKAARPENQVRTLGDVNHSDSALDSIVVFFNKNDEGHWTVWVNGKLVPLYADTFEDSTGKTYTMQETLDTVLDEMEREGFNYSVYAYTDKENDTEVVVKGYGRNEVGIYKDDNDYSHDYSEGKLEFEGAMFAGVNDEYSVNNDIMVTENGIEIKGANPSAHELCQLIGTNYLQTEEFTAWNIAIKPLDMIGTISNEKYASMDLTISDKAGGVFSDGHSLLMRFYYEEGADGSIDLEKPMLRFIVYDKDDVQAHYFECVYAITAGDDGIIDVAIRDYRGRPRIKVNGTPVGEEGLASVQTVIGLMERKYITLALSNSFKAEGAAGTELEKANAVLRAAVVAINGKKIVNEIPDVFSFEGAGRPDSDKIGETSAELSWTPGELVGVDSYNFEVEGYLIKRYKGRSVDGEPEKTVVVKGGELKDGKLVYLDEGLEADTEYSYEIFAIDDADSENPVVVGSYNAFWLKTKAAAVAEPDGCTGCEGSLGGTGFVALAALLAIAVLGKKRH